MTLQKYYNFFNNKNFREKNEKCPKIFICEDFSYFRTYTHPYTFYQQNIIGNINIIDKLRLLIIYYP